MAKKANAALQMITSTAKKIRRSHPGMKWSSAIKQAGVQYRKLKGSKKPAVAKKPATRKKAVGLVMSKAVVQRTFSGNTVASAKSQLKGLYLDKLGKLEGRKFTEPTKRGKRKISKEIIEVKKELRKVC